MNVSGVKEMDKSVVSIKFDDEYLDKQEETHDE